VLKGRLAFRAPALSAAGNASAALHSEPVDTSTAMLSSAAFFISRVHRHDRCQSPATPPLAKLVLALPALLSWMACSGRHYMEVVFRILPEPINRQRTSANFSSCCNLQIAVIAAIHHGIKDGKTGTSPYFWTCCTTLKSAPVVLRVG